MAKRGNGVNFLLALLLGTALALVLGLILALGAFFSILAGIGGLIAGIFLFRGSTSKDDEYIEGVTGITREMHRRVLEEGREKLGKLRAASIRIEDRDIKRRADRIADLTAKMLENIRKDPKDLRPARPFLNYYLDTAMTIIRRYTEISSHTVRSREADEVIARVDRTMAALENAFEKQLAALLENDVMDLDTELTVLEKTIRMEGFGEVLEYEKDTEKGTKAEK